MINLNNMVVLRNSADLFWSFKLNEIQKLTFDTHCNSQLFSILAHIFWHPLNDKRKADFRATFKDVDQVSGKKESEMKNTFYLVINKYITCCYYERHSFIKTT